MSRRSILTGAAAGAAALVAASLPDAKPVRAANGDNFILGQSNAATNQTLLTASVPDNLLTAFGVTTAYGHAIDAETTSDISGAALQARGPAGGVEGTATGSGTAGVRGIGPSSGQGVLGYSIRTGVAGYGGGAAPSATPPGTGVYGAGHVGVHGMGDHSLDATSAGIGVKGVAADISTPTSGVRDAGIVGIAGNPADLTADIALTGVYGFAGGDVNGNFVPVGVWGDSSVIGVGGSGSTGIFGYGGWGVDGYAASSNGIGVVARGVSGSRALRVEGRAEFTRSGRTTVAKGTASKKVNLSGCTANTLVFAVLGALRSGRWVRAVVPASGSFTIYLNQSVGSGTPVVWIAFTNPSNHGG